MIHVTTISTIQISNANTLLISYREHIGNLLATSEDLFAYLTNPTPEREIFLLTYCTCAVTANENIVLSTYTPK